MADYLCETCSHCLKLKKTHYIDSCGIERTINEGLRVVCSAREWRYKVGEVGRWTKEAKRASESCWDYEPAKGKPRKHGE